MKKIIAGFGVFCFAFNMFGQDEKVIIIDKGTYKKVQKETKERRLVDNTSVLKFSPLQMIAGEINFVDTTAPF